VLTVNGSTAVISAHSSHCKIQVPVHRVSRFLHRVSLLRRESWRWDNENQIGKRLGI
jgi:hypothetical protein